MLRYSVENKRAGCAVVIISNFLWNQPHRQLRTAPYALRCAVRERVFKARVKIMHIIVKSAEKKKNTETRDSRRCIIASLGVAKSIAAAHSGRVNISDFNLSFEPQRAQTAPGHAKNFSFWLSIQASTF